MKRLILTEKPSVAKSFAKALGCHYSAQTKTFINEGKDTEIINCVGHLYRLKNPEEYDSRFRNWSALPVIPDQFQYEVNPSVKDVCRLVNSKIKAYAKGEIIIATDADREGEVIARECLMMAKITDTSRIRRFWESQALTDEVILEGLRRAKPLKDFDRLALQGFARQKADWLCGMNFTRYLAVNADRTFRAGRVQTALLSEIEKRSHAIRDFKSKKYYEGSCVLTDPSGNTVIAVYEDENENRRFDSPYDLDFLKREEGRAVRLKETESKEVRENPPQLYNLSGLQKDAFRYFGYSAEKTLSIAQKLYEEYKCTSYPRTPSVVMGDDNVELCNITFSKMTMSYPEHMGLLSHAFISGDNKRIFDSSRLDSHHALIPLEPVPANATYEEQNVYNLILERFMLAFAPVSVYEKTDVKLDAGGNVLCLEGKKVTDKGWKAYMRFLQQFEKKEEVQDISLCDLKNLILTELKPQEKETRAPKFYNEASVIAFMENPSGKTSEGEKLTGLGTPATRHTFIPKLLKIEGIKVDSKKNISITPKGEKLLEAVRASRFFGIADTERTTLWEKELDSDPEGFLKDITRYVSESVS